MSTICEKEKCAHRHNMSYKNCGTCASLYDQPLIGKTEPVVKLHCSDLLKGWQPIYTAPRDGTLILLLISDGDNMIDDAEFGRTVGHNNYDKDGEDFWQFAGWCWSHDHYVEGRGRPVSWMPYPAGAL